METKLHTLKALDIAQRIQEKKLTFEQAFDYFMGRSKQLTHEYNIFVSLFDNDRHRPDLRFPANPLSGIPVAIKDNICIEDREVTCSSRILKGHTAVYDATVIRKLKEHGLAIVGTTNMDEFAFGSSTETSCYGTTRNPWDRNRVPGGSSGGSACAVALGCVPLALGSDTGGSIRQPASFCGIIGMKPTYGRVSRYGLIAFGSSLDQIGPFCRYIEDCAAMLTVICGHDPFDSTSSSEPVPDFTSFLRDDIRGIRIGLPKEYFAEGLQAEVKHAIDQAITFLKDKGAHVTPITLPHTAYAVAVYYIVATAEASTNLARFEGIRYGARVNADTLMNVYKRTRGKGFGSEAKRRILLGTYSLSSGYYDAYYMKGLKVRTLIKNDFDEAFKKVDVIMTPTAPTPAFRIGEKTNDPLSMYLSDIYTISANLAGLPAISMPCGFSKENLPVGVQFMGKQFDEQLLMRIGYSFQKGTDWHTKFPKE